MKRNTLGALLIIMGLMLSTFVYRRHLRLLMTAAIPGVTQSQQTAERASQPQALKTQPKFHKGTGAVPNRYIVVLDDESLGINDTAAEPAEGSVEQKSALAEQRAALIEQKVRAKAAELVATHGGSVTHVYERVLNGFVVEMSETEARALSQNPQVKYVEEDAIVQGAQVDFPQQDLILTQDNPAWGLDRIDQRDLPLDNRYAYRVGSGSEVHVYVIDSGVRVTHQDFEGRATTEVSFADNVPYGVGGGDCRGHGTLVASLIGGKSYGVAKFTRLHSVQVLDCANQAPISTTIMGLDWVRTHFQSPAVANLSISYRPTFQSPDFVLQSLDDAVRNLIKAGVTCVIAAGNWSVDVSGVSPARVTEAITVGSTDPDDRRSNFSNFGAGVDLFAPGNWSNDHDLRAASHDSDSAEATHVWGTSMAAPHVTGVAALYLAQHPRATPAEVQCALITQATQGHVSDPGSGSPNRLLSTDVLVGGTYAIHPKHSSGKAVDVEAISTANGARVQQWDYWGGTNQQWVISAVGDGYYNLVARHSGKALDVSGFSFSNGALIQQWDYWGGDNQKFELVPVEDGYYRITAKHSGKSLDVPSFSSANGALIQQWDYWGGDNQKFRLEKVN